MQTQDKMQGVSLIYLVGPRGCGKTSTGIMLARLLGAGFWDTDLVLAEMLGESIADFVAREGWEHFRDAEHRALVAAIEAGRAAGESEGRRHAVISTGGGIVLREENRKLLQETGHTFYLEAPVSVLARRLEKNPDSAQRPSLTGKGMLEEIAEVLAAREALYLEAAHHVIDAGQQPDAVCASILTLLGIQA